MLSSLELPQQVTAQDEADQAVNKHTGETAKYIPQVTAVSVNESKTSPSSEAAKTEESKNLQQSILKSFHRFPDLALEVRIRIWQLGAHLPRLIEFEGSPRPYHPTPHNYRLASSSYLPPAILQVSEESRAECKKFFERRHFGIRRVSQDLVITTYFNPVSDTLLFGTNTCADIMEKVFGANGRRALPRVAFMLDEDVQNCCSTYRRPCNDNPHQNPGRRGQTSRVLEVIHGLKKPWSDAQIHQAAHGHKPTRFFKIGCFKVEKIFVVVPTKLWPVQFGSIDNSIGYRPADEHETSNNVLNFRNTLLRQPSRLEPRIQSRVFPKWGKSQKPSVEFVALISMLPEEKVETLALTYENIQYLKARDPAVLESIAEKTGCKIKIVPKECECPEWISVVGTWESRSEAKKAIMEECRSAYLHSG